MMKRNGFHGYIWVALLLCLGPVKADEGADKKSADNSVGDIVTMMGWWDQYGRYWDETGLLIGMEDEVTFALLGGQDNQRQEAVQ